MTVNPAEPILPSDPPPAAPGQRELDRSLMHGVAWTGALKWATQVLSWAATLIIARILTPGDYGLVGMATIYLGFIQLVNEFGLGAAIVRERDLTEHQIASLGGVSLALGFGLWAFSALAAIPVARFFGEPDVRWIITILGVTFATTALRVLPKSLLARELRFRKAAALDAIEGGVAAAATLVLAILGFTYWSIVFGSIVGSIAGTTAGLIWRRHRLAWPARFEEIRGAMLFGWHIVVSRISWYLYSNADFTIVGRLFDKVALGGYTFAWTLASIPVTRISGLVGQVTPAIFSAVQNDQPALRRYLLKLSEGLAFITFPFSVGVALVAENFVLVALGEQWRPAILPLRLLAFYAGFRSITTLFPQVLAAVGRTRQQMRLSLFALVILPPMFYAGARLGGVGGVAWGWIIGYPIAMFPAYREVFDVTGIRVREYLLSLWPAALGSGVMAVVVIAVAGLLPHDLPRVATLAIESGSGALTYALFMLVAERDRVRVLRRMMKELRR